MSIKNFNLSFLSIHFRPVNLVAKKELLIFQLNYFWHKHYVSFLDQNLIAVPLNTSLNTLLLTISHSFGALNPFYLKLECP